jgi:antitoxin (DNA-binding transcriptional repressor) of toxin-antitoxin stability system
VPRSRCDCNRAVNLNTTLTRFACTRSAFLEEMKLADLSTALGVTNGVFLEMGGHDGLTHTNTRYLETCLHWRGVLIEADQWSFRSLRANRPHTLGVRAAACATHASLPMFTRNRALAAGRLANRRGETITIYDATTTVATVGSANDRAHRWVKLNESASVERVDVPCGPLPAFLRLLRIGRITVWFLDVEGAEELTLQTVDWKAVDVGLISVEFAAATKEKNQRVLDMLTRQGFVLSVCISIWRNHIYDLVFLRAAHFVGEGHPLPAAALEWLDQPEHRLPTKNGDRCPRAGGSSVPYALLPPRSVFPRVE